MENNRNVLQGISENELFASISKNRFYQSSSSIKGGYQLILTIRLNSNSGPTFASNLKSGFSNNDALVEDHSRIGVTYVLVYCKDVAVANKIISGHLRGFNLKSNNRNRQIQAQELSEQANKLVR